MPSEDGAGLEDSRAGAIAGIPYERILTAEGYPDGSDDPIYVSGSMVMPFGNAWSDIDVFVLGDRHPIGPYTGDGGVNRVSQHFVEDRRIDYEFWRPVDVRKLASRLAGIELGIAQHLPRAAFSYIEECFIDRLRHAIPLVNPDGFRVYRELFDLEKFSQYQTQEVVRQIDAVHEDVCGMLESGDLDTVLFSARHLVGLTVDAYLHRRGNTDPTPKWRARYLEMFADGTPIHQEVVEAYWRLEFPGDVGRHAGESARRKYSEACLAFCRRLTSWIQN